MNPILLDFPSEFNTERLRIRMPNSGDGKVVYESIQTSRTELKQWLPFAANEQTLLDTEENIRSSHVKFLKREDLRMLIFHKESGLFIGSTGLHRMDWNVRRFEIGYWLDSRHTKKGYMLEAVEGLTHFAFKELKARRIEIRVDSRNARSRAIPEKLGYELEGILRNEDIAVDGTGLRDTCIYGKIK